MKALQFNVNVPQFLIVQALRPISASFVTGARSPL